MAHKIDQKSVQYYSPDNMDQYADLFYDYHIKQ